MAFPFDKVVTTLQAFYKGDVPSVTKVANEKRDPYLVLVGCILSLRTKDEVTDVAAERLFRRARTPREILALPVRELEQTYLPCRVLQDQSSNHSGDLKNRSSKNTTAKCRKPWKSCSPSKESAEKRRI